MEMSNGEHEGRFVFCLCAYAFHSLPLSTEEEIPVIMPNVKKQKIKKPRPRWEDLPDLVLENIFFRLSIQQRYYVSMVCRNWNRIVYTQRVWSSFVIEERTMTRRRFNYYMGYQHTLDHYRTQICLHRVAAHFRKIIFKPISNFFNLYEMMNMLSYYSEFFDVNPLRFVHTLEFSFACHLIQSNADVNQELVFGTGGRLLQTLKRLVGNLPGLRALVLNDLLLERYEAVCLLDDVVMNNSEKLRSLRLVNCSRALCPILHVGVLLGLRELHISPQQLDSDVIELLGHTKLCNMHIVQNAYTEDGKPVAAEAWRNCRQNAPKLRVHLRVEGNVQQSILWQPGAPVRSITYNSAFFRVLPHIIVTAVDCYKDDLQIFAHLQLPRFYMPHSFHERADSSLILLGRQCPNLHTLVIREHISTATVLLLAHTAKSLQKLIIRRNAIIKRADWPRSPEWSDEFFKWLCYNAQSYDLVEKEVSQILRTPWCALTDKQFKVYEIEYS